MEQSMIAQFIAKNSHFIVTGHSMMPLLSAGSWVIIDRNQTPFPGDLLVFSYGHEGKLIHRLLQIHNQFYHLKGDNAFRIEIVPAKDIVGVVVAVQIHGKFYEYNPSDDYRKTILALSFQIAADYKSYCDIRKCMSSASYQQLYKMNQNSRDSLLLGGNQHEYYKN